MAKFELLKKSFYVEDCVSSLPSVKDATFLQEGSTLLLKKAGMDLRKWRANFLKCGDAIAGKVLGILWNVVEDKLEFEGRHPIILGKHSLVEMFVQYEHRKQKLTGVEAL